MSLQVSLVGNYVDTEQGREDMAFASQHRRCMKRPRLSSSTREAEGYRGPRVLLQTTTILGQCATSSIMANRRSFSDLYAHRTFNSSPSCWFFPLTQD